VHRHRRQFVRQGRSHGGIAVGEDGEAFAVGPVHRIKGLIGIELDPLDLGRGNAGEDFSRLDWSHIDQLWRTQGRERFGC
jgi:hypothetical protein